MFCLMCLVYATANNTTIISIQLMRWKATFLTLRLRSKIYKFMFTITTFIVIKRKLHMTLNKYKSFISIEWIFSNSFFFLVWVLNSLEKKVFLDDRVKKNIIPTQNKKKTNQLGQNLPCSVFIEYILFLKGIKHIDAKYYQLMSITQGNVKKK